MPRGATKTQKRPVIDPMQPLPGLRKLVRDWLVQKHLAKDFAANEKEANKALQTIIEEQAGALSFTDDKGHQWIDLGEEVEGWDSKNAPAKFNAVQRQRRVQAIVDEEAAIRILEPKGLLPEASVTYLQVNDVDKAIKLLVKAGLMDSGAFDVTTSVNEDKVEALYWEDKLSKAEHDEIITEKITWALIPGTL